VISDAKRILHEIREIERVTCSGFITHEHRVRYSRLLRDWWRLSNSEISAALWNTPARRTKVDSE
jgi:hypothetical protein